MGYLKGRDALMIFDKCANLKYKFGNRHLWAEGYYEAITKNIFRNMKNTISHWIS
jgi:REP element-mobilizing transposase RayT